MTLSILQIANKGINPPDGGTMAITLLTRELARRGNQVTLFTLTTEKHNNPNIFPASLQKNIQLLSVPVATKPSAIKILSHILSSRKDPFMAKRFYHPSVKKTLIHLLQTNHFDIIQLEGPFMGLYLPILQKYSTAPIILRAHNLEYRIWQLKAQRARGVKKGIYKFISEELKNFEEHLFLKCQGILPITPVDAKEIAMIAPQVPQMILPYCTDNTPKQIIKKTGGVNRVGYLGALDWQPNIEGLYWFIEKVWPLLLLENPEITLQVAGRNASRQLRRDLSKTKGVEFAGEIPDAEAFLSQQSVLVVPLWSGSGIRVKIIEGMSLGLPMVATSMALKGIEATHGKQLLIADTPENFAKRTNSLLSNPKQAESLGKQAQEFVHQQFNQEKWFPELIRFYKNIASHD
ncbi:MAG: glycosyltransferase family 4 protein [Bacteroidota bacterium]